jgi:putative flippase GtrA
VNRRITFGISGRRHVVRHQLRGLLAFAAGLLLTSGALAVLHWTVAQPTRTAELAVLLAASIVATLARFVLYRSWVFRGSAR